MKWGHRRLDELGYVGRGRSQHRPRNDPALYDGPYPFIQTADIQASRTNIRGYSQTYNEMGLAQSKLWDRPTLCMTIAGENTASTAILNFPACFPDSIVGFVADDEKADIRFVKYALDLMKTQFRSVSKGATQDNLSLAKILSFPISIPALPVQRRIASIIAAYDDLIENNLQRIVLLQESARLLFREWFIYIRFPGHEHQKIADELPKGWTRMPLGQLAKIRKGKNITRETAVSGTVPVVAGGLQPAYSHNEANALGPVITVSASGANAGYVALYLQDIWASDCSFLSASENANLFFIYHLMKARQGQITAMQQGAAQPHVYPKQLERLTIFRPTNKLLSLYDDAISSNFSLAANLQKQNAALADARGFLLPRLMTEEIVV